MANLNLNKVILVGRLTADPELKQTQSGISVTSFNLAVNRRYTKAGDQPQADFLPVVAWRQQAEFIAKYFKKGSSLCVSGSLQSRTWQDQQGNKRYAYEVVVDEAFFVDSKQEREAQFSTPAPEYGEPPVQAPSFSTQPSEAPNFEEISDDDDLPF